MINLRAQLSQTNLYCKIIRYRSTEHVRKRNLKTKTIFNKTQINVINLTSNIKILSINHEF